MANHSVQLASGRHAWITAELQYVSGTGRRSPRLMLQFQLRTPGERFSVQMHHVRVRVFSGEELLGEDTIVGGDVASSYASPCLLEIPVTQRMIRYVTDSIPANADVSLKLKWSGILRVKWRTAENDLKRTEDPEPDEWTFLSFVETEMHISIPRSDWFGRVLQPIADDQYLFLEVAVPKGPEGSDWTKALALLNEAEKAYALGDDSGVFAKLRGALDALPGAKQKIVDALPEPRRTEVNALLLAVGEYLHHGRHIATKGEEAGTFPVNRIDADAAISMVRVMFSYVSRALAAVDGMAN